MRRLEDSARVPASGPHSCFSKQKVSLATSATSGPATLRANRQGDPWASFLRKPDKEGPDASATPAKLPEFSSDYGSAHGAPSAQSPFRGSRRVAPSARGQVHRLRTAGEFSEVVESRMREEPLFEQRSEQVGERQVKRNPNVQPSEGHLSYGKRGALCGRGQAAPFESSNIHPELSKDSHLFLCSHVRRKAEQFDSLFKQFRSEAKWSKNRYIECLFEGSK